MNINSRNFEKGDFKWNTSVVLSHYNNEVKELGNGLTELFGTVTNAYLQTPVTRTVVGRSVGEFYGYKVKGIFKTQAQLQSAPVQFGRGIANNSSSTWLGDVQYEDVNGDGVINEKTVQQSEIQILNLRMVLPILLVIKLLILPCS